MIGPYVKYNVNLRLGLGTKVDLDWTAWPVLLGLERIVVFCVHDDLDVRVLRFGFLILVILIHSPTQQIVSEPNFMPFVLDGSGLHLISSSP